MPVVKGIIIDCNRLKTGIQICQKSMSLRDRIWIIMYNNVNYHHSSGINRVWKTPVLETK